MQLIETSLKHPLDQREQQMLEDYSLQRFQATPQMVLTPTQTQDLLNFLFARRAERAHEQALADNELNPHPIWAPISGSLPPVLQPLAARPVLSAVVGLIVLAFLLWLVL